MSRAPSTPSWSPSKHVTATPGAPPGRSPSRHLVKRKTCDSPVVASSALAARAVDALSPLQEARTPDEHQMARLKRRKPSPGSSMSPSASASSSSLVAAAALAVASPLPRISEDSGEWRPRAFGREFDEENEPMIHSNDDDDEDDFPAALRNRMDVEEEDDDDVSPSFESMMQQLASFNIPQAELEQCPLCMKGFPLSGFATHVYACLAEYDAAERRVQVERDEMLAVQLAAELSAPRGTTSRAGPGSAGSVSIDTTLIKCWKRDRCMSTDPRHFERFVHPVGHKMASATPKTHPQCPVCQRHVVEWLLAQHANACVDRAIEADQKQVSVVEGPDGGSSSKAAAAAMAAASSSAMSSSSSSSAAPSTTFQFPSMPGYTPPASSSSLQFNGDAAEMRDVDTDDDDDDEDDSRDDDFESMSLLSAKQMAACASMALQVKATKPEKFAHVLRQFEALGFTEENVKKSLKEHRQRPPTPAPASSSSSSSSSSSTLAAAAAAMRLPPPGPSSS